MEIVVEDVTFAYSPQVVALQGVSFTVQPGETVALIGENGAGKTTLAKHLNGLLRPDEGRVTIGGWDTRQHTAAEMAARVAFAFQNPDDQLFKRSVYAEVAFGPQNLGFSTVEVETAVSAALAATGLTGSAEQHPHDLHIAQRRWVAVAAALAMRTPIVVIDEPTIGQDARGVQKMAHIIAQLQGEGRTVIAISHHIDFCARNFARILVMAGGRLLAGGPPQTVFAEEALLQEAHVEAPQLARLAAQLKLPSRPFHSDSFLVAWQEQQGR